MKEISIKIDDELYHGASQKISDLEANVTKQVTQYLESVNGNDEGVAAARGRMAELFTQNRNFTLGLKPSREEMHER